MNKGKIKEKYESMRFYLSCVKCRKKTDHKFRDCQKNRSVIMKCLECGNLKTMQEKKLEEAKK